MLLRLVPLAVLLVTSGSTRAQVGEPILLEVIESEEPQASLAMGETLVFALGRPWIEIASEMVAPDSGAVADGAGTLAWSVPDYAVDAFHAQVRGGFVVGAVLDFSDGGPDFSDYAGRLRQRHGPPDRDGFYAADVLGLPFDLAVRPGEHRLAFRTVAGRTVPADTPLPLQFRAAPSSEPAPTARDTTEVFETADEPPEIVGGLRALLGRVAYPADALAEGVGGTVTVLFVVNTDGAASEITAVRSPDPRLSQAAVEAVRQTRFWPGHTDGLPVRTRFAVPVRFAPPATGD